MAWDEFRGGETARLRIVDYNERQAWGNACVDCDRVFSVETLRELARDVMKKEGNHSLFRCQDRLGCARRQRGIADAGAVNQ